ncbi:hypothetical protein SDJN02_22083, partial [Cucurbita argyrosperma subsp. argyrosperma]
MAYKHRPLVFVSLINGSPAVFTVLVRAMGPSLFPSFAYCGFKQTQVIKMRLHTLIKNALFSSLSQSTPICTSSLLQSMWDPPTHSPSGPSVLAGTPPCVHPTQGSVSSLAHCHVFGSDTICNSPSPPLADIVLFGLSLLGFSSKILKRVY